MWIAAPPASIQCAFTEDNVFIKHVVICSVWINYLALHSTEKTRENPGSEHGSCARCSHIIVQIETSGKLFLKNNILCILHLFSALLKSSSLVICPSPNQERFSRLLEKNFFKTCALCLLLNTSFSELIIYIEFQCSVLLWHSQGMTWYKYNVIGTKCLVLQRWDIFNRFTNLYGTPSATMPRLEGRAARM